PAGRGRPSSPARAARAAGTPPTATSNERSRPPSSSPACAVRAAGTGDAGSARGPPTIVKLCFTVQVGNIRWTWHEGRGHSRRRDDLLRSGLPDHRPRPVRARLRRVADTGAVHPRLLLLAAVRCGAGDLAVPGDRLLWHHGPAPRARGAPAADRGARDRAPPRRGGVHRSSRF